MTKATARRNLIRFMIARMSDAARASGPGFYVRRRVEEPSSTVPTIELEDRNASTLVVVAPSRGAIVTHFRVPTAAVRGHGRVPGELAGDRDVLYLDESTLSDPTKNVRGGIPVLFPTPGKLRDDTWSRDGKSGRLPQHGFARNVAWKVIAPAEIGSDPIATKGAASITMRLTGEDLAPETRAQWPWAFVVDMTVSLIGRTLRLEQRFENRSDTPMPFGAGFHPYFQVAQASKKATTIETDARHAFDNVKKENVTLKGIDLSAQELDLHLLDHSVTHSGLRIPGGGAVQLRGSPEYMRWVLWTLGGRDFVCLEPWTCPADAMNTGERLLTIESGKTKSLWIEITA